MVDRLEQFWMKNYLESNKKVLILNSDNGPENNSRRTQFIKRMAEFSVKFDIVVHLAYYPPYHSKYNPIEHVWGTLEQHWNGDVLECVETVTKFAQSMTYKGNQPTVTLVEEA